MSYVFVGQPAILKCDFDLQNSSLYSVKWYKDGNEFYRYMPSILPTTEVFAVAGIMIDVSFKKSEGFET